MSPKGTSSSKQVAKNGDKKAHIACFKSMESSNSSGDIVKYLMKGKVFRKGKRPTSGKKIATLEEILPRGPRIKILNTFPSHSPSSLKDNKDYKNNEFKGDAGAEKDIESILKSESMNGK